MKEKKNMPVLLLLVLLPFCCQAQRLSRGASDWYMRFHDFDMVKRHVDRPVTTRFHAITVVKHRYAVTEVSTDVHNPASDRQVFHFGFAMPKEAFISNVTLQRSNETIQSQVDASDWLRDENKGANGNGNGNGHQQHAPLLLSKDKLDVISNEYADFKQFVLPVTLGAGDNVTIVLQYELLLTRRQERYQHSISISPGEVVKDFHIRLTVADSSPLTHVNITAPVIGEITSDAVVVAGRENVVGIDFNMSEREQVHYFGSHGFTGDFKAEFDVGSADDNDVDLVVQGEHFLHFYDIPQPMQSMPKHVVFLLDTSESMSGPKMDHAKAALKQLLTSLDETDFLTLLLFNDTVREWTPEVGNGTISEDEEAELFLEGVTKPPPSPEAYPVTANLTEELFSDIDDLPTSGPSNLTKVLLDAIDLDKRVWETGYMPENAYTLFVVLTDGRAHVNHTENKAIRRTIRQANKISRVPIFILGMGFDANMDFLENIAEKSGGSAVSVIEDLDVAPQVVGVQRFLNDIVLKDLRLNYVGDAFEEGSLSRTSFKVFRQGGSVAVAGKWSSSDVLNPEFEVEITGQSAEGLYMENLPTVAFGGPNAPSCLGWLELCSEPLLQGDCISVNQSRSNLHEFRFGNLAASLNISGDCAWIVYGEAYYEGESVTLQPGSYDVIPLLQKDVSSVKMMPIQLIEMPAEAGEEKEEETAESLEDHVKESNDSNNLESDNSKGKEEEEAKSSASQHVRSGNSIERVWAFLTIQDVLQRLEIRPDVVSRADVARATDLALAYNFLTPFTDLYLVEEGLSMRDTEDVVEPADDAILSDNFVSYKDLNPVFLSMDDPDIARQWEALRSCKPPIQCKDNFHFEIFHEHGEEEEEEDDASDEEDGSEEKEEDEDTCTGSLTLYTKTNFDGESMETSLSIHQLYHKINSQRMRSIRATGTCCWLLFDQRFFSGDVEKVCGHFEQPVRVTNVGSVKKIGPENL